jgi:Zn-dependent peptidase ImmA (M78 family)
VPRSLDRTILRKADLLIARHGLHLGDPCQPVDVECLVEQYTRNYWTFRDQVEAVALRFQVKERTYTDIVYNVDLFELSESARKRHATVHEFAHLFLKHEGDIFVMQRGAAECRGLEWYVMTGQEAECERLSAYILTPLRALYQLHGMGADYIARTLDVPRHLVDLRFEVWRRFGK